MMTVTKEIRICYGHRVPQHQSKCRNAHGHEGLAELTVEGEVHREAGAPDEGMVLDFGIVKQALVECVDKKFDHRFLLYREDPLVEELKMFEYHEGQERSLYYGELVDFKWFGLAWLTPWIPTAEKIAEAIFNSVQEYLRPTGVRVISVRFHETSTCYAEYTGVPR